MKPVFRFLLPAAFGLSIAVALSPALAQNPVTPQAASGADPIATLVARLDLQRYKDTILGLTRFGDRHQGTARNRQAIDWIEAQLKSYGCATERIRYEF
jgi:hypothetical protein